MMIRTTDLMFSLGSLLFLSSSCGFFAETFHGNEGETGEEVIQEYYCSERVICLLADPSSPIVEKLIEDGLFVPHSLRPCEYPSKIWDAFQGVYDDLETLNGEERLQAAICEEEETSLLEAFSLCFPGPETWDWEGGMVGAIGASYLGTTPDCQSLDPYAFIHDYTMMFPCDEVACTLLDTFCACKCEESWDCRDLEDFLESEYGIDESDPWELACSGIPYVWDEVAFETGGWVGSTCAFNTMPPSPEMIPNGLVSYNVTCAANVCNIQVPVKELLSRSNLLLSTATFDLSNGQIVIKSVAPESLWDSVGLKKDDRIISVDQESILNFSQEMLKDNVLSLGIISEGQWKALQVNFEQ